LSRNTYDRPLTAPSLGVTSTVTTSSLVAVARNARSTYSVSTGGDVNGPLATTLTFQTNVRLTGSLSASDLVAVAVSVSFVLGDVVLRLTDALGGVLTTVAASLAVAPAHHRPMV